MRKQRDVADAAMSDCERRRDREVRDAKEQLWARDEEVGWHTVHGTTGHCYNVAY